MIVLERILLLSRQPLFDALSTEELHRVAEVLIEESYTVGDELYRPGDPADRLWLLVSGRVRIQDNGRLHGDGELLGEAALFSQRGHHRTARCEADSELLALRRDDLEELIHDVPGVALGLLRSLSLRLERQERPEKDDSAA